MVMHDQSDLPVAGARATWDGARTIAWLWGEHDLATADRLTQFLADAPADGDDLVVDLSGVLFMDASTISVIVGARSRMAERSRVVTVRSTSTIMERVFGICGLDELIEPADGLRVERPETVRSALESWVAVSVASREPAPDQVRPALEDARQASRE